MRVLHAPAPRPPPACAPALSWQYRRQYAPTRSAMQGPRAVRAAGPGPRCRPRVAGQCPLAAGLKAVRVADLDLRHQEEAARPQYRMMYCNMQGSTLVGGTAGCTLTKCMLNTCTPWTCPKVFLSLKVVPLMINAPPLPLSVISHLPLAPLSPQVTRARAGLTAPPPRACAPVPG